MVDIVNLFLTTVNLDEVFHCVDNIIFDEGKIFYIIREIKLLIELVASNTTEVIAALREEERIEVFFSLLYSHWLAWLKNLVDLFQSSFFCRFVIYRTFINIFNFLTFKTLDDHF